MFNATTMSILFSHVSSETISRLLNVCPQVGLPVVADSADSRCHKLTAMWQNALREQVETL